MPSLPIDTAREAEFQATCDRLRMQAADLRREMAALSLAPSVAANLDKAAALIEDYFKRSAQHAERNLRPHPHRRR